MYAQNGFMPVSNEVEATGRIVDGDKNIGYRLKIGDNREINLKTQQIISVVQLMHPKNFVVRRLTSEFCSPLQKNRPVSAQPLQRTCTFPL